jgi:hypothetical protein
VNPALRANRGLRPDTKRPLILRIPFMLHL